MITGGRLPGESELIVGAESEWRRRCRGLWPGRDSRSESVKDRFARLDIGEGAAERHPSFWRLVSSEISSPR